MRLTCPNCDAQYEVPAEVVPTSGRDVQCSSCGKTWFQFHPDHMPEKSEQEEETSELSPTAPAPDDEVAEPPAPAPEPTRKELDPAIAQILREEAETEFEARRNRQAETLESQPDLGLDTAPTTSPPPKPPQPARSDPNDLRRTEEAKQRMARIRGEQEISPEEAATAAAISSRRELLPDIDEINSTLRSDATPRATASDVRQEVGAGGERKRKGGFRRGLMTVLLLFVIFALIYAFAPQIAEAIPAIKVNLDVYVAWVDQLRVSLDTWLKSMLGSLDTIANETTN